MRALTRQRCKKGTVRRALLEAMFECERLGVHGSEVVAQDLGLCAQLCRVIRENSGSDWHKADGEIHAIFRIWPKFSGNPRFPVPMKGIEASAAYYLATSSEMWYQGQYAEDRRELCRHVAAEIRKLLE